MAIRNPRQREHFGNIKRQMYERSIDMMLASEERWNAVTEGAKRSGHLKEMPEVDYTALRRQWDDKAFEVQIANTDHIATEMTMFEAILPHLFKRNWVLLKATYESGGFVTSDHPAVLAWSDSKLHSSIYSPGFGIRNTEVCFPISKHLAIIGAFELENGVKAMPPNMVARFNGMTIAYSERQVYARDQKFHYSTLDPDSIRKASKLINDRDFSRPRTTK